MANAHPVDTTWIGIDTDGTLAKNWTNGAPDETTIDAYMGALPVTDIINFGSKRSRGTLTGTSNFIATETVTIDVKVYTFVASPSADGEVDLGVDLETSLDNLFAAINLVVPIAGRYGASMTVHPTVVALSSTATTLVVGAKDAGVAGDSIATTETGANASWGGATLSSGAPTGATMNNVFTDEQWPGDINFSGSEAAIGFNKIFHKGLGSIFIDVLAGNRLIIESRNLLLAAQIKLTSGLGSIEVTAGTVVLDQNGVVDPLQQVVITEATSTRTKLTIIGTGTIGIVRKVGGFLDMNGPLITHLVAVGGRTRLQKNLITECINASGFELESTTSQPLIRHLSGVYDMRTTAEAKNVTIFEQYPEGDLDRNEDAHTIDTLKKIGEN